MSIDIAEFRQLFAQELNIDIALIVDSLEYNTILEWDSIAHMRLIVALEDKFDIMIDTDDVIDMSTFKIAYDTVNRYVDEN
jgi:acyl carrier protein